MKGCVSLSPGWTGRIRKWFWELWGDWTVGQGPETQKDQLGGLDGSTFCTVWKYFTCFLRRFPFLFTGSGCQCVVCGQSRGHRLQLHRETRRLRHQRGHGGLGHAGAAQPLLLKEAGVPGEPAGSAGRGFAWIALKFYSQRTAGSVLFGLKYCLTMYKSVKH